MERKEQWIEEVMNSLNGIGQAKAPVSLHERILREAARGKTKSLSLSRSLSWSLAAGILLLIGVNVVSIAHFNKASRALAMHESSREVAREYFSEISN